MAVQETLPACDIAIVDILFCFSIMEIFGWGVALAVLDTGVTGDFAPPPLVESCAAILFFWYPGVPTVAVLADELVASKSFFTVFSIAATPSTAVTAFCVGVREEKILSVLSLSFVTLKLNTSLSTKLYFKPRFAQGTDTFAHWSIQAVLLTFKTEKENILVYMNKIAKTLLEFKPQEYNNARNCKVVFMLSNTVTAKASLASQCLFILHFNLNVKCLSCFVHKMLWYIFPFC